ncbi:MAG: VWA domain-containing protein [Terracidiphilus sp.]
MAATSWGQQGTAPAQAAGQQATQPELKQRQAAQPKNLVIPDGAIKINAIVTDAAGKPVMDLQPWDLKLMDNGKPGKILSFKKFDGVQVVPQPPVEVILVMDLVNLPFSQVALVRQGLDAYLLRNGGRLEQPVSVILLTDTAVRVQPKPSLDGNAVAKEVRDIDANIRTLDRAMAGYGELERLQLSARQMAGIAANESQKPGRKLVIWLGPGWPLLTRPDVGYYSQKVQDEYFAAIVELSRSLREAQIEVYSVGPTLIDTVTKMFEYQAYVKGVKNANDAATPNLALGVLAEQTGGKVMVPNNDMAGQIAQCVADANAYYRIGFDPPVAGHADEYHELKLAPDRPGLKVRTTMGYYDEPAGVGTGAQ